MFFSKCISFGKGEKICLSLLLVKQTTLKQHRKGVFMYYYFYRIMLGQLHRCICNSLFTVWVVASTLLRNRVLDNNAFEGVVLIQ